MTIEDIKTAINNVIRSHKGVVYSNETQEGYKKPAFFVDIMPLEVSRISAVYDEITLSVEIQYEPAVQTNEECLRVARQINSWFSVPISVGDRKVNAPDEIQHATEDTILFSSFTLTTTVIHNEEQYNDETPTIGEIHMNIRKKQN